MKSLVIFAKYPEPGKVKTRLGRQIGQTAAAGLYELFLRQTFELTAGLNVRLFVAVSPANKVEDFCGFLPNGFQAFAQEGASLGQRLIHAFDTVFAAQPGKVLAIGSDSPTLPGNSINQAFDKLNTHDLVLGPADDGGYYLIGIREQHRELFEGISWSSAAVLETTIERAEEQQLSYALLDPWYDVDDVDSLKRAARDDSTQRIRSYIQEAGLSSMIDS